MCYFILKGFKIRWNMFYFYCPDILNLEQLTLYICIYVCMYVYICMCILYICMYVCVYMYVYTVYMYVYNLIQLLINTNIYIYIYILILIIINFCNWMKLLHINIYSVNIHVTYCNISMCHEVYK